MRLPSGDQRDAHHACRWSGAPEISLPEVATIQIDVSYPVRFSSVTTRVKSGARPIGRNLRVGDPDETEQILFSDRSFRSARLGIEF